MSRAEDGWQGEGWAAGGRGVWQGETSVLVVTRRTGIRNLGGISQNLESDHYIALEELGGVR